MIANTAACAQKTVNHFYISDAFAYSLGRDLASSAASMGAGMLASEAGMGGFVSTLAASLAGTYVNTEALPQRPSDGSRPTGFGSTGSVSYDRNGDGFQAVNVEFDRAEFNAVVNQIKANIFAEALDSQLTTEETVTKIQQVTEQVVEEKAKVDATAECIEDTESRLRKEVSSAIGVDEIHNLAEGRNISTESRATILGSLSKSIQRLKREKAELNLHAPFGQNKVRQASLQTQNELIDEKILQYSVLREFLNRAEQPKMHRSGSFDDLLQDTYIRQGQRALGTTAGAFYDLAHEANSLSQRDYVDLQRSRLPAEVQDNPNAIAQLSVGYAFYKGAAKLGQGISALDDATGNVASRTMHTLGEGFEWIGTHTRRFVRDDLGLGQRAGQNIGDIAQIAAEIFTPGAVAKGVTSASKIVGASKFRSALGEYFGLYKGDVSAARIGLDWGGAMFGDQGYGMIFENYIASLPGFTEIRLPKNFKTFDFWDKISGRAVSAKTLDTMTASRILHPENIYGTLKGYIDQTLDFDQYRGTLREPITAAKIKTREIQLGIPASTGAAQMQQIQRAVDYGGLNNVKVIITRIGK